ncbi:MAG: hypothetical protein WAX77_03530 [Methylococcaceae bacterium]
MEVHTKLDIQQAFVVKEQDIIKIWKAFEDNSMKVSATIECSDELNRDFKDSESLIKYENPKRAYIKTLQIYAWNKESYKSSSVSLGIRHYAPINVSIYGDENTVTSTRTKIVDTVDGMKPWYSRIATLDFSFIISFVYLIILASLYLSGNHSNTASSSLSFNRALITTIIIIAAIGSIIFLHKKLIQFLSKIFPIATFAIGQGLNRHEYLDKIRWWAISTIVAGIVAQLLRTFFIT